jgi:amino acid adenylation domain-containing protein
MQINLLEYFEATVAKTPNKIAVIDGFNSITHAELYNKSLIISKEIISAAGSLNKPVAVFLPKSIESISSDIGISYSCNIYMNLDLKTPTERLRNIINLVKPQILITNDSYFDIIKPICNEEMIILNIDNINFNTPVRIDNNFSRIEKIIDTDPYCIINTSGSTGTPKSVVLNHRSFIDFTEWAIDTLKISDNEIIGSLSPLVFDIYSFELCMLMAKGNTMVLLQDTLAAFPAELLKMMCDNHVSFIFWVPTIMVNIANMDLLSKIHLASLRTVWFAGEVFPTKQFNYWKKYLPGVKFVNLYGPIEITLDCTYFIVDRIINDDEPIPIGFPCRNTDILILNENNHQAAINELGELCVRGSSLAMGYYNNPEKTSEAFVQNPLNKSYPEIIYRTGDQVFVNEAGEIIFKGRKDTLIKHLGYRIELGEIEHVIINTLKLVENGCVVYNFKKKEIVLFYEAKNEISVAEMRKTISSIFPKYMIPTSFIKMIELPRNVNGKIDRLYLNNSLSNNLLKV